MAAETVTLDLDAIEKDHYAIEWHLCGTDGMPDLSQPLGSFCAACTAEEYVSAIEFGDVIDSAADVVGWPCVTVHLVAEVRRLRAGTT